MKKVIKCDLEFRRNYGRFLKDAELSYSRLGLIGFVELARGVLDKATNKRLAEEFVSKIEDFLYKTVAKSELGALTDVFEKYRDSIDARFSDKEGSQSGGKYTAYSMIDAKNIIEGGGIIDNTDEGNQICLEEFTDKFMDESTELISKILSWNFDDISEITQMLKDVCEISGKNGLALSFINIVEKAFELAVKEKKLLMIPPKFPEIRELYANPQKNIEKYLGEIDEAERKIIEEGKKVMEILPDIKDSVISILDYSYEVFSNKEKLFLSYSERDEEERVEKFFSDIYDGGKKALLAEKISGII